MRTSMIRNRINSKQRSPVLNVSWIYAPSCEHRLQIGPHDIRHPTGLGSAVQIVGFVRIGHDIIPCEPSSPRRSHSAAATKVCPPLVSLIFTISLRSEKITVDGAWPHFHKECHFRSTVKEASKVKNGRTAGKLVAAVLAGNPSEPPDRVAVPLTRNVLGVRSEVSGPHGRKLFPHRTSDRIPAGG